MLAGWISINEYARRFNISDITVRRRIKQGKIPAELKNGKYYIRNDQQETPPLSGQSKGQLPPPPSKDAMSEPNASPISLPRTPEPEVVPHNISVHSTAPRNHELVEVCNKYLVELKAREQHLTKRYESEIALLETKLAKKDNEITALKQQIEDLQLLVKILEDKS